MGYWIHTSFRVTGSRLRKTRTPPLPKWERASGVGVAGSASDRDAYAGRVRDGAFGECAQTYCRTLPDTAPHPVCLTSLTLAKANSPLPIGRGCVRGAQFGQRPTPRCVNTRL